MTVDSLISELSAGKLRVYFQSDIIDKSSLYDAAESALRPFSNSISTPTSDVFYVKNYTAKVPDFHSLKFAYKCEPFSFDEKCDKKTIDTKFYKKISERNYEWSVCNPCEVKESKSYIVEEIQIDDCNVDLYYTPQKLSLSRKMNLNKCEKGCVNLKIQSENEISIYNNTLTANFKEGYVFLFYNALQRDEKGVLLIPETPQRHFYNYLKAYLIVDVLETVLMGKDDPNGVRMLEYWNTQKRMFFDLADAEKGAEAYSIDKLVELKRKQRKYFNRRALRYPTPY